MATLIKGCLGQFINIPYPLLKQVHSIDFLYIDWRMRSISWSGSFKFKWNKPRNAGNQHKQVLGEILTRLLCLERHVSRRADRLNKHEWDRTTVVEIRKKVLQHERVASLENVLSVHWSDIQCISVGTDAGDVVSHECRLRRGGWGVVDEGCLCRWCI